MSVYFFIDILWGQLQRRTVGNLQNLIDLPYLGSLLNNNVSYIAARAFSSGWNGNSTEKQILPDTIMEEIDLTSSELQDEEETARNNEFNWISAPELIRQRGYPVDTHDVVTLDGYKLRLFRIPGLNPDSTPVLIQHGLFNSCRDWLVPHGKDPLPLQLHDAGFDVWLASNRGTTYTEHVQYSPNESQFWNYNNQDIAEFDHPAVFDYILKETDNKKFVCIAYSWSGFTLMKTLISSPKYNSNIHAFIGIAPYVSGSYVNSPIKYLAQPEILTALKWTLATLSHTSRGCIIPEPTRPLIKNLYSNAANSPVKLKLVEMYLTAMVGVSGKGTCMKTFGAALHEFPNDVSSNSVFELLENMNHPKFYNSNVVESAEITQKYDSTLYDLSKVTVPKAMYFFENDTLVTLEDGRRVMKLLDKATTKGYVIKGFNHTDALYGKDVGKFNAEIVRNLKSTF